MYFTQVSLIVLAGATIATAAPLEAPKHTLYGRTAQYHSSCDKPGPDGGENMKVKAQRAFTDASQMAYQTQIRHDNSGNAFTESSAYRHYFADADKDQVKRMMQVIYNSRLPVDDNDGGQGYFIDIRCGNSEDPQTCGGSSLAGTNARPGQSVMVLCDRFFRNSELRTKNDFQTKKFDDSRNGWCQPNEKFPFFEIAGLTIFHEMTHLHTVGQRAELEAFPDPDGYDTSGTIDVYEKGGDDDRAKYEDMDPWEAARKLKQLWDEYDADNSNYKPLWSPIHNADSYAAAALEFSYLEPCKWDVILPNSV